MGPLSSVPKPPGRPSPWGHDYQDCSGLHLRRPCEKSALHLTAYPSLSGPVSAVGCGKGPHGPLPKHGCCGTDRRVCVVRRV